MLRRVPGQREVRSSSRRSFRRRFSAIDAARLRTLRHSRGPHRSLQCTYIANLANPEMGMIVAPLIGQIGSRTDQSAPEWRAPGLATTSSPLCWEPARCPLRRLCNSVATCRSTRSRRWKVGNKYHGRRLRLSASLCVFSSN